VHGSTPNFICVGTMSAYVPLPAVGSSGPWGRVEGKMGVVSFVHRTAIISIILSTSKCGSICRAQTCAHSDIEPSRWAKAILQGGPKSSKKVEFFTISRLYVHISQKRLKIEAYKQMRKKGLFLPYPTVACVWTHRSRGSTGWAKNSVTQYQFCGLRLEQLSRLPFLFSSASLSAVAYRAQTCTHSGIEPSTLAKGFL